MIFYTKKYEDWVTLLISPEKILFGDKKGCLHEIPLNDARKTTGCSREHYMLDPIENLMAEEAIETAQIKAEVVELREIRVPLRRGVMGLMLGFFEKTKIWVRWPVGTVERYDIPSQDKQHLDVLTFQSLYSDLERKSKVIENKEQLIRGLQREIQAHIRTENRLKFTIEELEKRLDSYLEGEEL